MAPVYDPTSTGVSPFWRRKYENEAKAFWNSFYIRNKARFYKDRHWLLAEDTDGFPVLQSKDGLTVLECGCGVANAAFPLLRANPSLRLFAFDFAQSAIELVRAAPDYDPRRCTAFVWDFARHDLLTVPSGERDGLSSAQGVDCILCLFVLSAVPPALQSAAVARLARMLKPGGHLLFRDYCAADLAALRFKQRSKLEDNYFVRQDGTLSYFFTNERLHMILSGAGLRNVYMRRIERKIVNRKEQKEMDRIWLQAVYKRAQPAEV